MSHRRFTDSTQVQWEVWDVHPAERLRELSREPREDVRADAPHPVLARELTDGWLCFESPQSKRRLWPIPVGWETMSDRELASLCARAVEVPPPRRHVVDHRPAG